MKTETTNASAPAVGAHTPGPWIAQHAHDAIEHFIVKAGRVDGFGNPPGGGSVASVNFGVGDWPIHRETAFANARLIASAPELLDQLRLILHEATTDIDGADRAELFAVLAGVEIHARAAIAKATGQA